MAVSDGVSTNCITVEAEFDRGELKDIVSRLKAGLQQLQLSRSRTFETANGDEPPPSLPDQQPALAQPTSETESTDAAKSALPESIKNASHVQEEPEAASQKQWRLGEGTVKSAREPVVSPPTMEVQLPAGHQDASASSPSLISLVEPSEQKPERKEERHEAIQAEPKRTVALPPVPPRSSTGSWRPSTTSASEPTRVSEQFSELSGVESHQSSPTSEDDGWTKISTPVEELGAAAWREVWRSDPLEHDKHNVTALTFVPVIEGLTRDSGHGGWLLSASKQLLNLWECSPGRSEPYLQVMHSQMTDYEQNDLTSEMGFKTLFAASTNPRTKDTCISLHSLSSDSILAPRGSVPVPPKRSGSIGKAPTAPFKAESLHGFGGPLTTTVAVNHSNQVHIFSLSLPMSLKTSWQAHESQVSQIHCSSYSISLFSASVSGDVSKWELRSKPRQAVDTFPGMTSRVTGLDQISEFSLLATSLGGQIATWDLRKSTAPLLTGKAPNNAGVSRAAISPEQGLFAIGTTTNKIYSFRIGTSSFLFQPVQQDAPVTELTDLAWNSRNFQLYSTQGSSVVIYNSD